MPTTDAIVSFTGDASTLALRPDLAPLFEEARVNAAASKAASTLSAYASDWRHFTRWCNAHKVDSLPASPVVVALYVSDLAAAGRTVATIRRRLAAIAQAHELNKHTSPTRDAHLREVIKGIRRRHGRPQVAKTALMPGPLKEVCAAAPQGADGLGAIRDRALFLVGFSGAFRREELTALRCSDLEWRPEGVRITVRRSKTDQGGQGLSKIIFPGNDPTSCPVRALRAWLDAAVIDDGPVFRKVGRYGEVGHRPMAPASVAYVIKRAARAAGMDPRPISGHSLRSGFATSMSAAGLDLPAIMRQTGHKSTAMAMRYVQDGARLKDNYSAKAGL